MLGRYAQPTEPNIQQYHYFTSEAKIGDKTYKILFDTEEYKGESTIKPQTVHLYDVREVKNSSLSANVQPSVKNLKEESNNIITDNLENFNPGALNMKKHEVQNHKEQDMALIDELKKLITKVENDKGEDMDDKEKVIIVGQVCPTDSTVIELQKITKNPPLN